MRCLTPDEAVDLLGKGNVSVSMKEAWYRRELVLSLRHSVGQSRVGCGQPATMPVFTFAHRLSLWLPGDGFRLVWVDHDEAGLFPNISPLLHAARRGAGEARSVIEAPGHLFDAAPWHACDEEDVPEAQRQDVQIMAGILGLMLLDGWDGWLIGEGTFDRVELWEGNVFFYSRSGTQMDAARELIAEAGCKPVR